ncbi:MAG: hypothetical protein IJS01_12565 [Lentisphaeria bacterium]|nr:hypothetical protein [Lentisphaeria bacterium]
MKRKLFKTLTAAAAGLLAAGCQLQFNECVPMTGDTLTDKDNMPFVVEAKKTYEARTGFRRNVELKLSEAANVFLTNASFREISVPVKRDLLLSLENTLSDQLTGMRDFNLVGRAANVTSGLDPQVSAGPSQSRNHVITYAITSIEFVKTYTVSNAVDDTLGIVSTASGGKSGSRSRQNREVLYQGRARVEVCLFDPAGNQLFAFNAAAVSDESMARRDKLLLKQAVDNAGRAALRQYTLKTAPPLYVIKTVGNGSFALISGGSAYGITPGSRIRFFRNYVRQGSALPGESNKVHVDEIFAGDGIVGLGAAPVGADQAWVYVGDFRKPEMQPKRAVFEWTSAKLIQ